MMSDFYIGQVFDGVYPPEAAEFCNNYSEKNIYIERIGEDRFEIKEFIEEPIEVTDDVINNLTMTALDLITLIQRAGVSPETIKSYLESNAQLYLMLFGCKDVYCGVVRQQLPITIGNVTLTDEMIVKAFREKNNV